jgi:hypothetical protein
MTWDAFAARMISGCNGGKTMVRASSVFLATVFALSSAALALDANDIILLSRNGVSDAVIINMVQNQGLSRPLTTQDVVQLNANGVSSELLEYLTRSGAAIGQPPIVASPVQPPVIVTTVPPTSYYYSHPGYVYAPRYYGPPRRGGLFFDFSFGGRRHRGGPPPRRHGGPPRHRPRRR